MLIRFVHATSGSVKELEARLVGDFFEVDWDTAGTYTLRRSKEHVWRSQPASLLKSWRMTIESIAALNRALTVLADKRRLETKSRCGLT